MIQKSHCSQEIRIQEGKEKNGHLDLGVHIRVKSGFFSCKYYNWNEKCFPECLFGYTISLASIEHFYCPRFGDRKLHFGDDILVLVKFTLFNGFS